MTQILNAIKNDSLEQLIQAINEGADVNATIDSEGATPLYIAAQKGHLEVVECLLTKGAVVNKAVAGGFTPYSPTII